MQLQPQSKRTEKMREKTEAQFLDDLEHNNHHTLKELIECILFSDDEERAKVIFDRYYNNQKNCRDYFSR